MTFDPATVKRISIADYLTMVDVEDYDKLLELFGEVLEALKDSKEFIENLQLDAPEWHEALDRCCAAIANATKGNQ